MKHPHATHTPDRTEAFIASAVAWLMWVVDAILTLGLPPDSRFLARLVRMCERAVEAIIFLMAVRRFGPLPPRSGVPAAAPAGFRASIAGRRIVLKAARIRARDASLRARVARLRNALMDSARYIARNLARLARTVAHLIVCAPPAAALGGDAPRDVAFADTS